MKSLLKSRFVDRALRGAALVVTDRRWAAPLSAAALGFGIFAGVAIGPGTTGTLATGAQQIIELPSSGGGQGQSGGGDAGVASTGSAPLLEGGESDGFAEAFPSSEPLAPEAVEPLPAPAPTPKPAPKPVPAAGDDEDAAEAEKPETQELEGTVVHANPAAGSYALAIEGGELVSVHAPELPEPGTKLTAPLRRLANGTFVEAGDLEQEKAMTTGVSFRGAITFVNADPAAPAYTVSGRGASLLVHVEPDPTGATPQLPPIGTYLTVTATIAAPEPNATPTLVENKRELEPGPPSTYLDLAGIFKEVTPETTQLLFSADDTGESEADLTLTVPKPIDAMKLKPGDSYLATATVEPDGSLKLSGIASDEHTKGADDPASAQGDLKR
ncbi:MAG: hypothetical protein WA687_02855 [Solirubrobacterales bacterium]